MVNMTKEIIDYINSQRIGVVAVEMLDGAPHAATVHFAFGGNPESIYIMTSRDYKKCQPIIKNGKTRASFVIGTDEAEMKTMQMDGEIEFAVLEEDKEVYFEHFPDRKDKYEEPDDVILKFTPTWWRYTDFKAANGKKFISSEDV
jgi:general stress protein 26